MSLSFPSFIPSGDISPCRFVEMVGPAFTVKQADAATDKLVGIAHEGTQYPPGYLGLDGLAGRSGGPAFRVFGLGECCFLQLGGSGCFAGDNLKSDALGQGIPATWLETANTIIGARAFEPGASGEKVRVQVLFNPIRPA